MRKEKLEEIEPGIRRSVEIFNKAGMVTLMSCEGHAFKPGLNNGHPWIVFSQKNNDREILIEKLKDLALASHDKNFSLRLSLRYYPSGPEMFEQILLTVTPRTLPDDRDSFMPEFEGFLESELKNFKTE